MKKAIPSTGKSIESDIDSRFGRATCFCIYEEESGQHEFVDNPFKDDGHGVGKSVVEFLINHNVNLVYAQEFGPKASDLMKKSGMTQSPLPEGVKTVQELLTKIN